MSFHCYQYLYTIQFVEKQGKVESPLKLDVYAFSPCLTRTPSHLTFWCKCYKTFFLTKSRILAISQCILSPTFLFQPNLMFVGKARSLPQNGAPERCFTWLSSSLAYTSLKRLGRDKQSSLLPKLVIYGQKKGYNIGPGANVTKLFSS